MMTTIISNNKEDAPHILTQYKVYCNGSGYEGGVGTAAILHDRDRIVKLLLLHIGHSSEHCVYESELTGIIFALHLLSTLTHHITSTIIIGLDNQARIRSLTIKNPDQHTIYLTKSTQQPNT